MPIQIDRMDTSIEITSPSTSPARPGDSRTAPVPASAARDHVRDVVGELLRDELERYSRNRGM
jgi:hypothetical protein